MFGQVQPGAEMRAMAMDHPGLCRRLGLLDGVMQFFHEGIGNGVTLFRPVEADQRDVPAKLHRQIFHCAIGLLRFRTVRKYYHCKKFPCKQKTSWEEPMAKPDIRDVALGVDDIAWEKRDDGSVLVWQKDPLPAYPDRLSDRIRHWAERTPDRVWMAERDEQGAWQSVTYEQMLARIRSIGQALLDLGLNLDRPLVILSGNSTAHGLMALSAQYVGIPSAAIAPAYSAAGPDYAKLRQIAEQIQPGAVFAEDMDAFAAAMDAVFPGCPRLGRTGPDMAISWDALCATTVTDAVDRANAATGPDTIAKFMFTSGTTGTPKAVIQTQRMLCSNMEMVRECYAFMKDEPPVLLDWAPWNHVASGNKVFNMAFYNGGTFHVDTGRPTPALIGETLRNLRDVSPNWFFNVPVGYELMVEAMKADPDLAECFFRDLKLMMYAGAAMAEHTWADLDALAVKVTGKRVFLSTGLGATETAPHALFNLRQSDVPGNVGVPAKGVVLKLVPKEGRWEAHIKGPSVTPGYWKNDELTRAAFDEEGFYNFGDALRFADPEDPAKGFFFDGRTAENFKLATGTWVGVGPLRAKLIDALQGLVRDLVIAGEGRNELGALLVPFRPAIERIVPGGAALPDEELVAAPELRTRISQILALYNESAGGSSERIKRTMILTDPLDLDRGEVTDKGSVNQRVVLRTRADLVEALYGDDPRVILSGDS
jgi:feruloyl-CoA synthase